MRAELPNGLTKNNGMEPETAVTPVKYRLVGHNSSVKHHLNIWYCPAALRALVAGKQTIEILPPP